MLRFVPSVALLLFATPWLAAEETGQPPLSPAAQRRAQAKALAERIDRIIAARLRQEHLSPGPRAGLVPLARRLHLDLTGRIPSVIDLADLIDPTNDSTSKLEDRIDELLASDRYAVHFANVFRSIMLRGANDRQQFLPNPPFENWLRVRLAANKRYDAIAREVLAAPPGQPEPAIFYNVNGNRPETLARVTARAFLGVRLECAECHPHPYARLSPQGFWEFAAFFARSKGRIGQQIRIPRTREIVPARFLTGEVPVWKTGLTPRETLAEWTTAPQNPYFARATVDHLWQNFFGVSLLQSILEPADNGPPPQTERLEEMTRAFVASKFDLKFLIQAIVLTDAYRRESVAPSEDSQRELQLFARMPVRGMTPDQLFDSICVATDYRDGNVTAKPTKGRKPAPSENMAPVAFLAKLRLPNPSTATPTSVLEALYQLNRPFIEERSRQPLDTIALQNTTTQRRVEALYMMVLARPPRPAEIDRMVRFIESGGSGQGPRQAVAEVCGMLLNSSEFMLNH
jgi:hypothetical protein